MNIARLNTSLCEQMKQKFYKSIGSVLFGAITTSLMPFPSAVQAAPAATVQNPPAIVAPVQCSRDAIPLFRMKPSIDPTVRFFVPVIGQAWQGVFNVNNAKYRVIGEPSDVSQMYQTLCKAQRTPWAEWTLPKKQAWLKTAKFRALLTLPSNEGSTDNRVYRDFAYFDVNGQSFLLYCEARENCWEPTKSIGRLALPGVNMSALVNELEPKALRFMVRNVISGSKDVSVYKRSDGTQRLRAEVTNSALVNTIKTLFLKPIPSPKQLSFMCKTATQKPTYSLLFYVERPWPNNAPSLLLASVCEAAESGQIRVNVYSGSELSEVYAESNAPLAGFSIPEAEWKRLEAVFSTLQYLPEH